MEGGRFNFELRTAGDLTGLERTVRNVLVKYAPNLPLQDLRPMQTAIDDDLSAQNALARLLSGFGLLALASRRSAFTASFPIPLYVEQVKLQYACHSARCRTIFCD